MAKVCRTPSCANYGKELDNSQLEFQPRRGVYLCAQCYMEVEVTSDAQPAREVEVLISRPPPLPPEATTPQSPVAEPTPEIIGAVGLPSVELYYRGSKQGKLDVKGDEFIIGRGSVKQGIFPDLDLSHLEEREEISRLHARIFQDQGKYFLEDLASKNGTFLNDFRLKPNEPQPLKDGDLIVIGNNVYGLIFRWHGT